MKALDLFAGKGWKGRKEELEKLGWEVTTLDIDPSFGCDIIADIMDIDDLGLFDFVWASVPCETWSVASIGHHWNKDNTPKTEEARNGMALVQHTIKLINESSKIGWVIENPRGKLRKMPFMQDFKRQTITYCQYGEDRMKPTDIWYCGFNWNARPMCKNGDSCHKSAPRGSKTGTQGMGSYADKSVVPTQLWVEILQSVSSGR